GCDAIFVIGANPASNHPRFMHKLKGCRDRGGQVIIINPAKESGLVKFALPKNLGSMLSGGSEIASMYVQPKIGSDIALFYGIMKAVLEKGGENRDFIARYTDGIDPLVQLVGRLEWEVMEAATGVG